jgi:predicted transcriptional regulator
MGTRNISARIPKHLLVRLDRVARSTKRNRSWLISKAIEDYVGGFEDAQTSLARLGDDRLTLSEVRKKPVS